MEKGRRFHDRLNSPEMIRAYEAGYADGHERGFADGREVAPALLAALRDLLKLEQDRAGGRLGREAYERRMQAGRAALAAAEGRTL